MLVRCRWSLLGWARWAAQERHNLDFFAGGPVLKFRCRNSGIKRANSFSSIVKIFVICWNFPHLRTANILSSKCCKRDAMAVDCVTPSHYAHRTSPILCSLITCYFYVLKGVLKNDTFNRSKLNERCFSNQVCISCKIFLFRISCIIKSTLSVKLNYKF